ncbi:transmembrane protein 229A [Electrophorus electricus]|uniref:transmembrane protein 229A n=1 Tax=Electrophorus electricus TaxID=8005 RepID=UPI000F0A9525|nr:transmembrane protein 229A [Electrophorus electricus]
MSRRRDCQRIRAAESVKPQRKIRPPGSVTSSRHGGEHGALPRWMRLYFYGMHGLTLDIVLSSAHRFVYDNDLKLLGLSSPYLCVVHSITHFVLEKIYLQKKSFQGRPVVFHCIFYPSLYIGLQILVGNVVTLTDKRIVSVTQLALHYILALYFTNVFHKGFLRLRYHDGSGEQSGWNRLPGGLRFVFFGMHGFLDEVVFTSVFNLLENRDRALSGHTSIWSFLMYGSCSFVVDRLYLHLHFTRGWGRWRRMPLYICLIYTWEFCWGAVLRHYGACSWDYSHYPLNFMGLVTLLYLPGWFCLSLYQDVLSDVLLRVVYTEDVDMFGFGVNGRSMSKKKH